MDQKHIRNFCIIAHIDHGKSTLADRLLEATATLGVREMRAQVLDSMDLERERGITIKAHAIRMEHHAPDGAQYQLNLIDTPGHVDFNYEVSRSLAACEGALLVVDAVQGVQAQTLSNLLLAMENDLAVIPVINKIDLAAARIEEVAAELMDLLAVEQEEILLVSAKQNLGVDRVLEAIIGKIPAPSGNPDKPLRALIFDSSFDFYRGAVPLVRVVDGYLEKGMEIRLLATGGRYEVLEVGLQRLKTIPTQRLSSGEVGYVVASIKRLSHARVGDTIVNDAERPHPQPLPGYREVKPMVFAAVFPMDNDQYDDLKEGLERLHLNDASLSYEPESSLALGFGFRCGFLGMLHMEIVQERLLREHGVKILATVPNVRFRVNLKKGEALELSNPAALPDPAGIENIEEPLVKVRIFVPSEYVGPSLELCNGRRGEYLEMLYLDQYKVELIYLLPLSEILFDFYDRLKTISRGYASFDYELQNYRKGDLVRLDILINGEVVDALSAIIHRDKARTWGMRLIEKLKELIPRQLFEVVLQAAIGGRVIAREVVRPLRKNVTAKCYGGDITRKRKLIERQREGKRRMKQVGKVEIPQEAFLAVLKMD
ncbi:MAG: elongation factor 4 [Candidatus Glassbacteria bacterium RIFCSPLOWO2_12_FULL_58_11]|uniref:Elongation factor 4 n=1 Tax=Candidatus Glassbacteria bacterium RIFCSPLOWO2_12_FULL_58_11 TaxID=1817867 RepID=A0A1F5YMN9_9BACT|nr:MAG: elongation factor 4 [Candidatus Glassbacteria bacterium RIFCSPLOWO2_12_FULL_58_11]